MYKENNNKSVNILGTDYKIVFKPDTDERLRTLQADGYTDTTTKELIIGYFEPDERSMKDLAAYQKKVMRHEIIHAFFYESGLWNNSNDVGSWALNEEMTDWIAIQHSKLHKAFEEAGAL